MEKNGEIKPGVTPQTGCHKCSCGKTASVQETVKKDIVQQSIERVCEKSAARK